MNLDSLFLHEIVFSKPFSLAHFLYYGIIIFCEYPSLTRG